jgi:hypothetical protein
MADDSALPQERLPDSSEVLAELTLTPKTGATMGTAAPAAVAAGTQYRVLRTLEVDEYDAPVSAAEIMALAAPRAAPADNDFAGHSRKPRSSRSRTLAPRFLET